MTITDSELCMLEQLTYMVGDRAAALAKAAGLDDGFPGVEGQDGCTIAQILKYFDEEALAKLEALGDTDLGNISAKEWAEIIRYLQTSELGSLILADIMVDSRGETMALCFAEAGNTTDAIVAFRGTTGSEEWVDDVEGLNESDTQYQTEALDYIESLPYENITVTGHSKGGSESNYAAVFGRGFFPRPHPQLFLKLC